MLFSLEHSFAHPPERVERAVLEPGFQDLLKTLPNVGERTVTEYAERPDGTVHRVIRYRFDGQLPAAAVRTIGSSDIEWDEISLYDPARHVTRFRIEPLVFRHGLVCSGRLRYLASGPGTLRRTDVDLSVKVPLVGRLVENAIRQGWTSTMHTEAELLADYLAGEG